MHLDMHTARYVIGPEKPVIVRRPASPKARKPDPVQAPPEAMPSPRWPRVAKVLFTGLAAISALLGHLLLQAMERRSVETERAAVATVQAEAAKRRLFKLAAEYDQLSADRRSLLRGISAAMTKEADAKKLASQWAKAHELAQAETASIATRWSEHSSGLERSLNASRSRSLDLQDALKAEQQAAAREAGQLNQEIQGLAKDKAAVEREADGYHNLARQLDSTASSLRSEVSSLQASKSSLESENSSLRSQNASLSSEISCLNSKVSSLQSELCSLRSQLANAKR